MMSQDEISQAKILSYRTQLGEREGDGYNRLVMVELGHREIRG